MLSSMVVNDSIPYTAKYIHDMIQTPYRSVGQEAKHFQRSA